MRKFLHVSAVLAIALLILPSSAQVAATAPSLPDQIQKVIDTKAYRPALQMIAQALPTAAPGDKYALLMMRGECLLQLKDGATAILAFDQAAAAAASNQQDEAARAMSLLIRKSSGLVYTPRTGDRKPLDITDPDARKPAMVALLTDQLPAVTAQVNQALAAKTLPPILALVPTLRDLHALEQIGAGDDARVTALVQPLADRTYELIEAELNRVDQKVQAIQRVAGHQVDFGSGSYQLVNGVVQRVPDQGFTGLTGEDRQTLRDTIAYLSQIGQTCDDLAAVARRFDRDGVRWQALSKQTQGILDFARAVYDHE